MEVILRDNVSNLGYKDDLVTVKGGYGRNYLIPKGLAIVATDSAKKIREENLRQKSHKLEKVLEEARKTAERLEANTIQIGAKVGESGKIFGSVNTVQLADAIKKMGVDIDRKNISITNEPIKEVGNYEAVIVLHRDIKANISFEVVGE